MISGVGSAAPVGRSEPCHRYDPGVAETSQDPETVPTPETTISGSSTATTLIGPNGTAPGMSFIEQQEQPIIDAQPGRVAGAPLAIAALLLLAIFTVIVVKAARASRRSATGG